MSFKESIAVCVVALVLGSCEGRESQMASKKLETWNQQMTHFMGKVIYRIGEEIPMITEKKEEEIFVVTNMTDGFIYSGNPKENDIALAIVYLHLESPKNKVFTYVEKKIGTDNQNTTIAHCWVGMNKEVDDIESYPLPYPLIINDFDVNQSTISITGASGTTAVFQYDVGLIQLSDTMGHTWTKK